VIALGLLVGFYGLALAMALGLLAIPYLEWVSIHRLTANVAFFCVIGAGVILWSLVPRPDRFTPPGPRLDPAQQPQLFATLNEVARATGQAPPAEVYLAPDVNAWVAQRGGILGVGGRRVMGIGLGLLPLLTVSQLRAVLAHEYGHYYGGDTRLGPLIYRAREAIGRTIAGLARHSNVLQQPFIWYGNLFLRVTHAISRQQELQADVLAARVAGAPALAAGLRATHSGAAAYQAYWESEVLPLLTSGYRPPLVAGFTHFIAQPPIIEVLHKTVEHELAEGQTDPYDTHPPLRERLAAAARLPATPPPADDPPALSLLNDVPGLEIDLLRVLGNARQVGALRPVAWEAVGTQAYVPLWEDLLRKHPAALAGITLQTLPQAAGELPIIGGYLIESRDGQLETGELKRRAITLLGAALAIALVRQGWALDALPGDQFACRREKITIQPFAVIRQLAAGELSAAAWEAQCANAEIAPVEFSSLVPATAAGR